MKTDKLEQFVKENKPGFGPSEGAPDVWNKIKKREPETPVMQISWQKIASRAASVVVIFIASYYFHDYVADNGTNQSEKGLLTKENLSNPLFQELLEADQYYTAEINYKKQELFSLTSNSPELQMDVNNDFADLDAILLTLKNDLGDNADSQEVVEAMIENYMLKLEILEDLLSQIKARQETQKNDEKGYTI
jgi:hypothetical protein